MWQQKKKRLGLTLIELTAVLLILVALATLLVPLVGGITSDAQQSTTLASMKALRDAVLQYYQDMKGIQVGTGTYPGTTGLPTTLKDLQFRPMDGTGISPVPLFNPVTRLGWRGPYLEQATGTFTTSLDSSFGPYGTAGDPAFLDGWGNPIVLQWPTMSDGTTVDPTAYQNIRLVSAGPPNKNSAGRMVSAIGTPGYDSSSSIPTVPLKANRGNDLVLFILIQDPTP